MATNPSPLTVEVAAQVQAILAGPPHADKLLSALRYLAKWRSEVVSNTLTVRSGTTVLSGPFAGMAYTVRASEGSRASRVIGAYEASLAPIIEKIIAMEPEAIVDIGSAEGYYAVGLARRLVHTRVLARDASPRAQALCRALAKANGVADRVEVGGTFTPTDFDMCRTLRTVIICDIEGAEAELLDPARAPGLAHADILVEVHDAMSPGLSDTLAKRFAPTHRITRLGRKIDDSGLPDWMEQLSDLDRLIALWEWRSGPTPWLWMEKK